MDKKILIAVDDSENSRAALLYVAGLLGGFPGFRAIILSVVAVPEEGYFHSPEERRLWLDEKTSAISRMLERYREILIQAGFPEAKVKTELAVASGVPVSSVILEKQEQFDACTLVVGRRGISKSEEFLFGSVSSRLIHQAGRCAVWVIEPVCKTDSLSKKNKNLI
ncbi:MAG: universal stress protein [Nitrospiraceae bacterium]|nr:universal stress protein [Nitrospiraceae bacterium]